MTKNTFKPLADLYNLMDSTWNTVANDYDFKCNGCKDNCCKSLFFHHTYVEKSYLLHGFNKLDDNKKEMILSKAEQYCQKTFAPDLNIKGLEIKSLKIICPVNENDICLLYPYRPMICRLHGLPHELHMPGAKPIMGDGCDAGMFHDKLYIKFDRTPFYLQMSQIEMVFRQDMKQSGKIKETVAQMIVLQSHFDARS